MRHCFDSQNAITQPRTTETSVLIWHHYTHASLLMQKATADSMNTHTHTHTHAHAHRLGADTPEWPAYFTLSLWKPGLVEEEPEHLALPCLAAPTHTPHHIHT